jgi:multidrug efflux pump subunit AcrB
MNSPAEVGLVPLQGHGGEGLLVRDVARVREGTMPGEYDRYNMRRLVSITANIAGEDLGRVVRRVQEALRKAGEPPRGVEVWTFAAKPSPWNKRFAGWPSDWPWR